MIEQDTIKLLRECDAGVKMGISSIEDVIDYVVDEKLKEALNKCKDKHGNVATRIEHLLEEYHDDGKDPNPTAKGMSWLKNNAMLVMNESDSTIADLMTEGCNMGVKSLNKYLNQYEAADEQAKNITKDLIRIEDDLVKEVRAYL
jgi:hypothetical protein